MKHQPFQRYATSVIRKRSGIFSLVLHLNNFNYGPTNSWVIGESKAVARGRIRSQCEREKRYI